jgi:hypothetical protein
MIAPIGRLSDKLRWLGSVAHIPAQSVKVFYRANIGIDEIPVAPFSVVSGLMLAGPHIFDLTRDVATWLWPVLRFLPVPPAVEVSPALAVYAVTLPAMVLFRRRQFIRTLCQGVPYHSKSRGVSPLERLTALWPRLRLSHIYGVVEPALVAATGYIVAHTICVPLGYWLMLAGASLAALERGKDQAELSEYLGTINAILEDRHRRYVRSMVDGHGAVPAGLYSIAQSGGLSTGIALDIAPQVELLRAEVRPLSVAQFTGVTSPPDLLSS